DPPHAQATHLEALRHLEGLLVEQLVLEHHHGVRVLEGGQQQFGGVARVRGHDHLDAGDAGEPGLQGLGVLGGGAGARAAGGADHQRHVRLTAHHEVQLRGWLAIWSIAWAVKSENWISTMGRMPVIAAPTPIPTIPSSEMVVSRTRSGPKRSMRSFSTPKAPPYRPTSSPIRKTRSSAVIASAIASRMASEYVISRVLIVLPPHLGWSRR